jgi:ADP-heptose:LPS heptosyltransferase
VKVVIFKLNHLGDSVVFVPTVQALRGRFPDWQITLVTTPHEADLYGGDLGPQKLLVCPKDVFDKSYRTPWVLARWLFSIRSEKPEACLVAFDQGNAAHFVATFSGAHVRVGGNLGNIRFRGSLTENVPAPPDGRPVTWSWDMARALVGQLKGEGGWPQGPPPPDFRHLLARGPREKGDRRRVVIHAGSGGGLNQWGPDRFAAVARSLSGEFEVIWLSHGNPGRVPDGTVGAAVESLAECAEWLASADLFLGNNSGPMHLANALGCSGIVVTGPSAMGWDPYWHREKWTVLRHPDLYCAPCERIERKLLGCANLQNPMACLDYWTVEKVEGACRARLNRAFAQES